MAEKQILVFAARHGETVLNAQDCFRGPLDIDLNANGRRQAHQLSYYFEPIDLSYIFCSARKRTRETAAIIAKEKPGLKPEPHEGLYAWNVGHLAGQKKDEENVAEVKYHVDHPEIPIEGGESLNEFKSRIRPLVGEAVTAARDAGKPILLVVHSSVIHEIGDMINADHASTLVQPGGVAAIYIENGELHAEPIFRPDKDTGHHRADIIT